MGANAYVGTGVTPGNMAVTNNEVFNEQASTSTSYAVTLMGSYNVVENNTIRHKGSGIISANVQWASGPKDPSENNTYRNNVLTGCGISATKGSLVENNTMTAALSLGGADMVVIGNTAGSMTVGTTSAGGNITVDNNTINGAVTINKAATGTVFTNNLVKDTVTVNSNENTITDNQISTEKDYAIDLKTTSNNIDRWRENGFTFSCSLYQINDAIQMVNLIGIVLRFSKVRNPCRLSVWANIIRKYRFKYGRSNGYPITIL